MTVTVLYSTKASATGGRDGRAETSDGSFAVDLSTPKELGGAGGQGNNPEQLFAAGYAACFIGAMKFVAAQDQDPIATEDATVTATVGIGPKENGGFGLTVELDVSLPEVEPNRANDIANRAHEVCPYSNAIRNNIAVKLSVIS
ncbi:organic hydroperoxide resistance protein [Shimia marina]|jgi:Ohr subfamily peroxiredoxin|uniref:organic hydroperoxide resistance protein n=1 Tax=Shimia marina TaxID=321267 RepID=UPI0008E9491C|nr:organic hydroperoxide resistance protein [Shimia marina]SFE30718.1 peroxiredoxin, Ohr subfamily [Shimia marina]